MRESRASHVSRFDEGDARFKIEIPIIKEGDAAKGAQASDLGDLREPKPIDLNLNRRRP